MHPASALVNFCVDLLYNICFKYMLYTELGPFIRKVKALTNSSTSLDKSNAISFTCVQFQESLNCGSSEQLWRFIYSKCSMCAPFYWTTHSSCRRLSMTIEKPLGDQ